MIMKGHHNAEINPCNDPQSSSDDCENGSMIESDYKDIKEIMSRCKSTGESEPWEKEEDLYFSITKNNKRIVDNPNSEVSRQKKYEVFICGMDWWITEADLEKAFQAYGPKNIDFGMDKINGKSKGWATFEVSDRATLDEVIRKYNRRAMFEEKKIYICGADEHSIAELVLDGPFQGHMDDFRDAWGPVEERWIPPPPPPPRKNPCTIYKLPIMRHRMISEAHDTCSANVGPINLRDPMATYKAGAFCSLQSSCAKSKIGHSRTFNPDS